jgi:hypothetical protein
MYSRSTSAAMSTLMSGRNAPASDLPPDATRMRRPDGLLNTLSVFGGSSELQFLSRTDQPGRVGVAQFAGALTLTPMEVSLGEVVLRRRGV